jgi:ATP-dependent DNA helicase RecQ
VAEQEIGKELLLETAAYAESADCRRKLLLHYFGETYQQDNCGNCDNCLNPKKKVDATELLTTVIETIAAVKEKFKTDHIVDILIGKTSADVESYQHDDLETFGSCKEDGEDVLNNVIRKALIEGYLDKEIENYGVLKITAAGKAFLKKPKPFQIVMQDDFDNEDEEIQLAGGGTSAVDPAMYSMLKNLRKQMSKQLNLPPYVIFQDPSLEAMATTYPITIEELQNIPGVGQGKAKRYGDEFIALIKRHVEENEIERPEDLRVRTVANKSKVKISIIQAIDRKVALDDLAQSKGMSFGELLDEIEAIVYSGTKINITYFLEEVIDEDKIYDLLEYFKESDSDSVDQAMEEMGDCTEEEVRLVRIKFLSEFGN